MKLTGIHHVSIVVSDMERAVAFYRDVLGLPEVMRPSNFVTPVRWFELGNEQVHLIPALEADVPSPRHFAIHVDDCEAARVELTRRGATVQETVPIAGAVRFFIADPDGNTSRSSSGCDAGTRGARKSWESRTMPETSPIASVIWKNNAYARCLGTKSVFAHAKARSREEVNPRSASFLRAFLASCELFRIQPHTNPRRQEKVRCSSCKGSSSRLRAFA